MSRDLRAVDLLSPRWVCVSAFDRYRDVVRDTRDPPRVFVVLNEDRSFMGLVEEQQAALFPGRVFADLIVRRPPSPIPADATPEQVLAALERAPTEHLPVVDETGALIGVTSRLGVFGTLVERERAMRDEREALIECLKKDLADRQIAAAVFAATSEGIMVTDAHGRIILVNRAFVETTGYTEEEAIGQTPRILHSGRHGEGFYEGMWQSLKETGSWESEIWNRRKNGEIYPEWLHINAIHNEAGEISHYAGVFSDITRHKELRAKLHHLAYHDALTDLPNRQLFMDRVEQAIAQARRREGSFSLLFIDLDGFKDINDSLGHGTGDRVLTHVAQRLRDCVREVDTVARLGGDEFIVVLDRGHDDPIISAASEKIFKVLADPVEIDGHELFLSASIGISRYPEDGETAEELLRAADTAMYRAKEAGKGTFRFHTAEMHDRIMERVALIAALRQALADGDLTLAWQPQVSLHDGRVTGLEALARWTRKGGSPVGPDRFIPLAEQTGLIHTLGEWVIGTACREAAELLAACPGSEMRFAVNVSPLQVQPTTHREIMDALSAAKLDPRFLEIELTENSLATGHEGMLGLLRSLGEAGVQVAVDDFGTGCSNIATIKLLPIHRLKLDRSFVMDLTTDPNDREIAVAIITMAHALGLEVVAEGVETEAQAAILTEAGCDHAQGYLYSRPQGRDDLLAWLRSRDRPCADSV